METTLEGPTLEAFRAGLKGAACVPSDEGYEEARAASNLTTRQTPEVVVVAEGVTDIMA